MDEPLRETLFQSNDPNQFVSAAGKSDRWKKLSLDACDKARRGLTSVDEVLRVTRIASDPEDEMETETAAVAATPED
jgi:type II secretory ATPase GspE/PulE/Tfp pilus assembly ATPase PilB-like protein